MKSIKILLVLFFILIKGTIVFAESDSINWTPAQSWNTNFNFGGDFDQITEIIIYQNSVLGCGWKSGSSTFGAISNFNLQNGSTNWIKVDENPTTMGGLQFAACQNKVFYTTGGSGGKFFIIRDLNSGNVILNQSSTYQMSMLPYGDSVIAVTHESFSRVLILNSNGNVSRQFTLGYNLNQGTLTLRMLGENIWINGYFFSNGVPNFFVEKRNLFSGNLIWRHEIVKAIRCYSDLDAFGNFYIGANIDSTTTGNKWWFMMEKLDQNRNQQWQKLWIPNQFGSGENTVSGLSVSPKGDIVTLVGTSNVGNPPNSNFYKGYVFSRDAQNGDSVFSFVTQNTANTQCGLRDVVFDTSGAFIIVGVESTTPSRTLFLRKYQKDSLVGVINPNGEIPKDYSLSQNYPNPFNPVTNINFSIPKKMLVTIKVYDILGREVKILVNEIKNAGNYKVDFDGNNLSSGTYFYRLETEGFTDTKKMILIK